MIVGVGVDIVEVRRIAAALDRFGERFVRRILTPEEYRPHLDTAARAVYVARQFAAKEAVSKALGTGMRAGVCFSGIRVLRRESGAPFVELTDAARLRADEMGVGGGIHISLSDERDYVLAFVVAGY